MTHKKKSAREREIHSEVYYPDQRWSVFASAFDAVSETDQKKLRFVKCSRCNRVNIYKLAKIAKTVREIRCKKCGTEISV